MNQTVEKIKDKFKEALAHIVEGYTNSLKTLRTGVASLHLLEHIRVDVYGEHLGLHQLATLTIPEPQRIVIEPWDKGVIQAIEKAITQSGLHVTVQVDGAVVYVLIPVLTEELRKDIVKELKQESEKAKVSMRNIRRETNEQLKALHKSNLLSEDDLRHSLDEIQDIVNHSISSIEALAKNKEHSLLSI